MKKSLIPVFLVFAVFLLLGADCFAQAGKVLPTSAQQITLSYAPIVKNAAPAVVNIYTRKLVKQRIFSPFMGDPFFERFFGGNLSQGMTRQRLENSLGSGVLISPDGLIVTSNHVIAGADQINVVLADRREFDATLVTTDDRSDLAVLRINSKGENLPYIELKDSDDAEVGDLVLAIGNPFGVGQTVTSGIISALARTNLDINDLNYFIQTDAAINPGNSGGALITTDGKLIGINSAIYSRDGGSMGIGFAVPSNMVRIIVGAVTQGKKVVMRPWTGIDGQEVTPEVAKSMNLTRPTGMLVNEIHTASPAKGAGLKVGDVIISVNGKSVDEPAAFRYRIATMPIGADAEIGVLRSGQKLNLPIKLIAPPENPKRDETLVKGQNPLTGAVIANMSPAVSEEYGLRGSDHGVVVLKLSDDAPASNLGLQAGDMVLSINNIKTETVNDVMDALHRAASGWRLSIRRGDNVVSIMVGR